MWLCWIFYLLLIPSVSSNDLFEWNLKPLNIILIDVTPASISRHLIEISREYMINLKTSNKQVSTDPDFCDKLKKSLENHVLPTIIVSKKNICPDVHKTSVLPLVLGMNPSTDSSRQFQTLLEVMRNSEQFGSRRLRTDSSDTSSIKLPWWMLFFMFISLFVLIVIIGLHAKQHLQCRKKFKQPDCEVASTGNLVKKSKSSSQTSTKDKNFLNTRRRKNKSISKSTSLDKKSTSSKSMKSTMPMEEKKKEKRKEKSENKKNSDKESLEKTKREEKVKEKEKSREVVNNNNKKQDEKTKEHKEDTDKKTVEKSNEKSEIEKLKKVEDSEVSAIKPDKNKSKIESADPLASESKVEQKQINEKNDESVRKAGLSYDENDIDKMMDMEDITKAVEDMKPVTKRTSSMVIQTPITADEFMYYLNILSKFVTDYVNHPEVYPVSPAGQPGFIYNRFPRKAPEDPDDFDKLYEDIKPMILDGLVHWQHPRFHGHFPTGRNYACIMSDTFSASLGVIGYSWDTAPALTELEQAMVNWMGNALGLPQHLLFADGVLPEQSTGGGVILDTSADAIYHVLVAARTAKIKDILKKFSVVTISQVKSDWVNIHAVSREFVVYTSKEAHGFIEKACKVAMMRCKIIQAPEDREGGLTGELLNKEIEQDIEKGLIPIHVHLTLGNSSTESPDQLESIHPVAKKHEMWIHVDASYGASAWMLPQYRTNTRGLEHVTSLSFSAHKMLQHLPGHCFLWVRDQKTYKSAFSLNPDYNNTGKVKSDLTDWGITLNHRFISLRTWFVMRLYGIKGLQAYVERLIEMAAYFESLVSEHPNLKLYGKRNYGIFTFQYKMTGMTDKQVNEGTKMLWKHMQSSHKIFFSHIQVHGNDLIKVSVNHEYVTKEEIDLSWKITKKLIKNYEKGYFTLSQAIPERSQEYVDEDMD